MPCGCQYGGSFRWLCINTEFQRETQVVQELWPRGMPVTWVPQFKSGGRIKPLFPTYLLVQVDLAGTLWREIYRTPGVVTILGTRFERPTPVADDVLAELWRRADADGHLSADPPSRSGEIAAGAEVELTSGPFSLLTGICQKSSAERVTILFQLLGREVRVTAPRAGVVELGAPRRKK